MLDLDDVRRIADQLPETRTGINEYGQFAASVLGNVLAWTCMERITPGKSRFPNPAVLAIRVANLQEKEMILGSGTR